MKLRQAVLYLACLHASTVVTQGNRSELRAVSDRIHLGECTVVLAVIDSDEGRV